MDDENESAEVEPSDAPHEFPVSSRKRRSNGGKILLVLLVPMFISAFLASGDMSNYGRDGMVVLLFGCPIAGVTAGCMYAGRLSKLTEGQRIAAAFGMSIVFTVSSVALSFVGCISMVPLFSLLR
jgi:hypothetical protein